MTYSNFKRCLMIMASLTAIAIWSIFSASVAQAFSAEDLYYFEKQVMEQDRSLIDLSQRPEIIECIKYGTNCPDYGYIVQVFEYWAHFYGRSNSAFMMLIVDVDGQIHVETDLTSYFEDDGNFLVSRENGAIYDLREAVDMMNDLQVSMGAPSGASGNTDKPSPFSDDPSEGFLGHCDSMSNLRGCPYVPSNKTKTEEAKKPSSDTYYPYGDAPGVDFHYSQQLRGGGSGSGTNPSGPDTFLDAITEVEEAIRLGIN